MLLNASAGGRIRTIIEQQVKYLIKKMCLNEYRLKSERSVKIETVGTPKGMLVVVTHTALLGQIKLLNKTLAGSNLKKAKMGHAQALRCNFCGEGHANRRCSLERSSEKAQFSNFQKNNPYYNTYNLGWKDHPNL